MNARSVVLEPKLEELLRAVARNPESTLLRVPRAGAGTLLLDDDGWPAGTTGLDSQERELARVFASELASLLQDLCAARLLDGGEKHRFIGPYERPGEPVRPATREELRKRVRLHRDRADIDPVTFDSVESLLEACVGGPRSRTPSVVQLAAAAYRLRPDPRSRVLAACDLLARGLPRASMQMARSVLEVSTADRNALRAWECIGASHGRLDQFDRAFEAYGYACADPAGSIYGWMSRFYFACWLGERDEARSASEHVNSALVENDELVGWFVTHLHESWARGPWDVRSTQRTATFAAFDLGAAGRIGRAFHT